ncbi:MAG: PBP1A family penicillin-binding protein [Ignavibacteriales bacterium]|nr:PBP1A family penicillin-binding protein [Ignavibacteriales bacterium]
MAKKKSRSKKIQNKQTAYVIGVGALFIFLLLGYLFYRHIVSGLPSLDQLENPKQSLASSVISIDNEIIGQYYRENRREISIDSIPSFVVDALISTEDRKFYDHWGVDLGRFIKAMFKTVFLGKKEGASTITQQLAKNLYDLKVARENLFQTGVRKIREWFTAIQIEQTYTKREILEMYLNNSFFGNRAYGIEMATQNYFGKSAKDLTLPEAAVFIGLLKSHVYYNPIRRPENALQRRNVVLYNMVDNGKLSEEEYDSLKNVPLNLTAENLNDGMQSSIAPHFVEYVRKQLESMADKYGYNLYEDGLKIYTTIHSKMQKIANKAATDHLAEYQKLFDKYWNWSSNKSTLDDLVDKAIKNNKSYLEARGEERKKVYRKLKNSSSFIDSVKTIAQTIEVGFVCLDVTNGEIRAMIGGKNQDFSYGLNHATQTRRQPGSAFKPIVYTAALDNGLYPAYPIINQEFNYNGWNPHNFDNSTGGFMTLRDGLKNSENLISARLIIEGHVELWQIDRLAHKLGIKSKLDLVPSISLGTSEVTLLELTSAYATLADKGIFNEPISILKIEDKDGILIDQFSHSSREALSAETSFLITDMLETVINEGTGVRTRSIHKFYRPAAGKTGTTQDYADAWFMGYTPQLAAGVWVGFDDRRVSFTGKYGQGSQAANPIWSNFMREVYNQMDFPFESFTIPENGNITTVKFCRESIYQYGNPRLYSNDCSSGELIDFINLKDIPDPFVRGKDNKVNLYTKFYKPDSLSHEAVEIEE